MQILRRIPFLAVLAAGLVVSACQKYDDTELWNKVNELDQRLTTVENTLSGFNSDINSIKRLVDALNKNVSITSILKLDNGFKITFSDGSSYTITSGAQGEPGEPGQDGASAPVIGVKLYNGVYYWTQTIDGVTTWLTDALGNKMPVSGSNGVTPLLKVSTDGYWMVSYDGGIKYEYILDSLGNKVKAVGSEGSGGNCNCQSFFKSVTYEDGFLVLVLMDGTVIRLEVYKDPRMDSVVPEELQLKLSEHMPLYTGINPPDITGEFVVTPFVTVYCEDNGYPSGHVINNVVLCFSDYDPSARTLNYFEQQGDGYSSCTGACISGDGDFFTAFFNTEGVSSGVTRKTALVISGRKTTGGIEGLTYSFVLVEKGEDPNHYVMDEGVFRVFEDQDGFSEFLVYPKDAVDLGLPSKTRWATCNVGASSPEQSGNYYAWGEIVPKSSYTWDNYKWGSSKTSLTKYNADSYYGNVDNLYFLEDKDDAALAALGAWWRMPTYLQTVELCSCCEWTWGSKNGVNGYTVTSYNNGNSIFIPVSGIAVDSQLYNQTEGYYWGRSLDTGQCCNSGILYFSSSEISADYSSQRIFGMAIRPVFQP
ncbi:MAG: DUF4988 domain-containing protein [Bacteroidales bacterium]|nr:DUF4988 domain-containing protein [Bacteroidales bacterium]